ncbi:MAG: cytochrome c3 family protein [Ignavibacteriaceae bacterium]
MKIMILAAILYLPFFNVITAQSVSDKDQCFNCHEMLDDKAALLFKKDIHHLKGISCAACHGGDSSSDDMDLAMDPKKGYTGVPKGDAVSERCITCHSDSGRMKSFGSQLPTNQFENIKLSVHWKLALNGKEHIMQCTTCHNAHGIVPVSNPLSPANPVNVPKTCSKCHSNELFMISFNPALPVDQYQKYKTSRHGILNSRGDSKVAECASCHGSHYILPVKDVNSKVYPTNIPATCSKCHSDTEFMSNYKIPTDQYEKFAKSVHGIALLEKNDINSPACNDCHGNHGAVPPGVESISKVCGSCHALNAELFSNSPHKKVFDENNYPECETCHGNHEINPPTINMLGVTEEAVCSQCHTENENKKGFLIAKQMKELLLRLESEDKSAGLLIEEAEQKGMEISEAKFKLRDIRQARLESGTMIHAFDLEKFKEIVDGKGLTTAKLVSDEASAAIEDFYFRRYGLVASIFVISLLALSIFFYIKRLEKKQEISS